MAKAMQEQTAYKPEANDDDGGRNLTGVGGAASNATARRENDRRRNDCGVEARSRTRT